MKRPQPIVAAIVLVIVAVGAAAAAANLIHGGGGNPLHKDPLPTLFPAAAITTLQQQVAAAELHADAAAARWLADHPRRDDTAFSRWAIDEVGAPPAGAAVKAELAYLHQLGEERTPSDTRAATWLETHGKKDVWNLYGTQVGQFSSKPAGATAKALVAATYALAKTVAAAAKTAYARPAPYDADPTLNAQNKARFAGQARSSYPSKHSVIAAAEVAVLTRLAPQRQTEFRWMQGQIDYSRLVAGGHYPSDVVRGAFLGRLIGDYELHHGGVA